MRRLVVVLALGVSIAAGGCDAFMGPSKVAQGQLYTANDPRYDPYFSDVHKAQVAAASWPDEEKAAKKPIASALDLPTTASYSTIVSALRERKKGREGLGSAVDETVRAHQDLARKMTAEAERLGELAKKGDDLEESASEDRKNMGADKADEEKVKKKEEVRHELSAARSAASSLSRQARTTAREAEAFAADLKRAWDGKDPEPRSARSDDAKPSEAKASDTKHADAKPAETAKPEPKPAPKAVPKKADPPPPKPKSDPPPKPPPAKPNPAPSQKTNDEVFNP